MKVTYIDHMGTDLSVVNAARVSFNKTSDAMTAKDEKLVNYLASHGHWTPFGHATVCLHMKLPFFVQRQIDKHQVGFVVNEVSRRYVDDPPEFYVPDVWRSRPEGSVKQGSGDETTSEDIVGSKEHFEFCAAYYSDLIDSGIAPEMARMVLPMSTYTESHKTGSLYAWANMYKLRIDAHAQKETQEVAKQIGDIIEPIFPVSWKALTQ